MELDERKKIIISIVVDEYIKTGEPIASNTVLSYIGFNVSSATIRSDMANLEKMGFLEQPHTSAGRIPTFKGYRFYIENIMSDEPLKDDEKHIVDQLLLKSDFTMNGIIGNAVDVMSQMTNMAVISSNKPQFSVITRVDVIPAGRRLYAILVITSGGSIKNKICRIEFDITKQQIEFFSKFINDNLYGLNFDELTDEMLTNLAVALGSYMISLSPLIYALNDFTEDNIKFTGETNLLSSNSLNPDEVVELLDKKNDLVSLLDAAFGDVSVVFGKENNSFAITNSSLIISPYKMNQKTIGSFGVIGPTRVDYKKIMPHIRYITDSVSKYLEDVMEDYDEEELLDE